MKRNGMMRLTNFLRRNERRHKLRWHAFALLPLLCVAANAAEGQTNRVQIVLADQPVATNAPSINFLPLHDEQTVVDFSDISGEIDAPSTIQFSICHVGDLDDSRSYWNGANWVTNRT